MFECFAVIFPKRFAIESQYDDVFCAKKIAYRTKNHVKAQKIIY